MRIEPCGSFDETATLYRLMVACGMTVRILTPRAHGMWALMVTL